MPVLSTGDVPGCRSSVRANGLGKRRTQGLAICCCRQITSDCRAPICPAASMRRSLVGSDGPMVVKRDGEGLSCRGLVAQAPSDWRRTSDQGRVTAMRLDAHLRREERLTFSSNHHEDYDIPADGNIDQIQDQGRSSTSVDQTAVELKSMKAELELALSRGETLTGHVAARVRAHLDAAVQQLQQVDDTSQSTTMDGSHGQAKRRQLRCKARDIWQTAASSVASVPPPQPTPASVHREQPVVPLAVASSRNRLRGQGGSSSRKIEFSIASGTPARCQPKPSTSSSPRSLRLGWQWRRT